MNKIKTMAIATLACVALCGTTMAAPAHRGGKPPAPARQHQKAPDHKPAQKHGHAVARHHAPAPAHRHHAPAPRPCPPPPPPPHLECHHDEASGLAVLGAALIGGIVGAICN